MKLLNKCNFPGAGRPLSYTNEPDNKLLKWILVLTQLAHDVVATLGFSCILVATSDNVVTTLYFRRHYYDEKLTLLQRRVFDVGFPT